MLSEIKNYRETPAGKLTIGILYYSLDEYFKTILPAFRREYPQIVIDIKTYQPHEMYEDLLAGNIDICELFRGDFPGINDFVCHDTGKGNMIAMLRSDDPLSARESVSLKELSGHTLIELSDDRISKICTEDMLRKCGAHFENIRRAADIEEAAKILVQEGGVHLTGENCRKQSMPGISYITISDRNFKFQSCYIYPAKEYNKLIDVFIKHATSEMHR
ncbi:MAG: LysR family transcriptional regulator substrate-binding protein [Parasporobacterium sp.]|nr:LysR family transcriptional regulator substrate-binding protein [Parasporobacterium sp.]